MSENEIESLALVNAVLGRNARGHSPNLLIRIVAIVVVVRSVEKLLLHETQATRFGGRSVQVPEAAPGAKCSSMRCW